MIQLKRFFFSLLLTGACTSLLYSQTQAEIEMAKSMAKQYGYTEGQINSFINSKGQVSSASKSVVGTETPKGENQLGVARAAMVAEGGEVVVAEVSTNTETTDNSNIFGHKIFKTKNLNFIPSYNIPTPDNYKLSSGDEIVIDVWGDVITNITATISPEGAVNIPDLGPVYILGQTVKQAQSSLKDYMAKIYSGIKAETPTTFVKISLGKIRSVTVNVLGEVENPGTYTVPSLSTIASALYLSGGPTSIGTIRDIKLYRNSKLISTLDVYSFIIDGKFDSNVRLEDNDVIMVGPYTNLVSIRGSVKRAMRYEVKKGETIQDLINYAGGLTKNASTEAIYLARETSKMRESFEVKFNDIATFALNDGDSITVRSNYDRFNNNVSIVGGVWSPGTYALGDDIITLKQLIEKAGGLIENAYMEWGIINRLDENREPTIERFNLNKLFSGEEEDIVLERDDEVVISTISAMTPRFRVRVLGEVKNQQELDYREGMTIGDLIFLAGGLTDAAQITNVEIARRVRFRDGLTNAQLAAADTIATILFFNLKDNPEQYNYKIEPYDILFVRRSPGYIDRETVSIMGEVLYPGSYYVEKKTVRLSDLVKRASGFTSEAYVKGAKLTRVLTDYELQRLETALDFAKSQVDENKRIAIDSIPVGNTYTIAMDLEEALKNPGSYADVVLRQGDLLTIPQMNNVVKIGGGGVVFPTYIVYNPKYKINDYIYNAGGYSRRAIKKKLYVTHMNGMVQAKNNRDFHISPGCEITVPAKQGSTADAATTWSGILGIASTTASLAAMVVTIINQVK